jgi:hypothetical protein
MVGTYLLSGWGSGEVNVFADFNHINSNARPDACETFNNHLLSGI